MPDLYTAFKQNGLGHMIPKSTKQRRYSSSYSTRPTAMQQAMQRDLEYYKATVPPEWRFGHSYIEAYRPSDRTEFKAMHNRADAVFSQAIRQLGQYAKAGRW